MSTGSSDTVTQTQVQDVPEWMQPYYTDLLEDTTALTSEAYVPYEGQRVVGDNADLLASQGMVRDIAGQPIEGFDYASGVYTGLGAQAGALGQQQPASFSTMSGTAYAYDPTRQFSTSEAETYMSPYMQLVIQQQQADALEQFQRQQASRNAAAVDAGAFGGSRQAVQEGVAEEALANQMGTIYATGMQQSYEQAQMQFERDRAAQMTTEQRMAEEAARVQGIDVSEAARVQQAQADEAMRQRQFELQTMGFSADMAGEMSGLGTQQRQADIQSAQLLEAQGLGGMSREQAGLDVAYEDFLRQEAYPEQQLALRADIIGGMPVSGAGTTTVSQPTNPMQEALGGGIAAYGMYRGMQ
jgi:hypothetical protein